MIVGVYIKKKKKKNEKERKRKKRGEKARDCLTQELFCATGQPRRFSPASPGLCAKGTQRRAPVVRLAPLFIGQERLTDVVTPDSTPLIGHGRLYRNPNHFANNTSGPAAGTLEHRVEGDTEAEGGRGEGEKRGCAGSDILVIQEEKIKII